MIIDYWHRDYNHSVEYNGIYSMRTHIEQMWKRCQELGLSPDHIPKPQIVDEDMLLFLQSEYSDLIEIVTSYTKKIELIIPMDNAIIDLYTKDFVVIHRIGSAPVLEKIFYSLGSVVAEKDFGNTALSASIEYDTPAIIFGEEHFLNIFKAWACFCVPIHGAYGDIIAALNIMLPKEHANQNLLGLIMVAVRGIENEIMLLDEKTELTTTNEMLAELNAGVLKTASMLSHEIRNSLSTISAYVQLLQLQEVLDNAKGDKILTEIGRINKLLNNFRSLSEPLKFKLYKCSLDDLLISIVSSLSPKASMSNVTIDLLLANDKVSVMMDAGYMERVFINIIVNAIQAMEHDGGTLKISCVIKDRGRKVHITFEDTGPGIAEDKLDDIFKLFYTTKEEGTGLGLAMCKYIVQAHGGEILLESTEGVGTKFIIILPCIKQQATE